MEAAERRLERDGLEDFTCACAWEKLVLRVEDTLTEWGLAGRGNGPAHLARMPTFESHAPRHASVRHKLQSTSRHYSLQLHVDPEERPSHGCPIARLAPLHAGRHDLSGWFGCSAFVILRPAEERALKESEAAFLLSTLSVAARNVGACVPLFVPVGGSWRNLWAGSMVQPGTSVHTRLDVRRTDRAPPRLRHLDGIASYFHERVGFSEAADPRGATRTTAAASFVYTRNMQEWDVVSAVPASEWRDTAIDRDAARGSRAPFWGPQNDPVHAVHLSVQWPPFPHGTWTDNEAYTDMDPLKAPDWEVRVDWTEPNEWLDTPLASAAGQLARLAASVTPDAWAAVVAAAASPAPARAEPAEDGGDIASLAMFDDGGNDGGGEAQAPFLALRGRLTAALGAGAGSRVPSPAFFDEAIRDTFEAVEPAAGGGGGGAEEAVSAPYGSPLSVLVLWLMQANSDSAMSLRAVQIMWRHFVDELRFSWDNCLPLVRVGAHDNPDHQYCLVHQKLQLLQRCIRLRRRHEEASDEAAPGDAEAVEEAAGAGWSDADLSLTLGDADAAAGWGDDADLGPLAVAAAAAAAGAPPSPSPSSSSSDEFFDAVAPPPAGVLRPLAGGARLTTNPSAPLNVPVTQDVPRMTEDQARAEQELLERMGDDPEGRRLRAEKQCEMLTSDMEAFKAANPGCALADFVRWHSPRDWDAEAGRLSERMAEPSNLWHQLWRRARVRPAAEQPRLFDHTAHAEMVLDYLETIEPRELLHQLACVALDAGVGVLERCEAVGAAGLPDASAEVAAVRRQARRRVNHRAPGGAETEAELLDLAAALGDAEKACSRSASALRLFGRAGDGAAAFVNSLVRCRSAAVTTEALRRRAVDVFGRDLDAAERAVLPARPSVRMFSLLRVDDDGNDDDNDEGGVLANRMFVRVSESEFRMATAWSSDLSA